MVVARLKGYHQRTLRWINAIAGRLGKTDDFGMSLAETGVPAAGDNTSVPDKHRPDGRIGCGKPASPFRASQGFSHKRRKT